ncbi:MAG: HAMP domain-containing sensor histidine kinase [Cyclobacteriaceae bacterium]|nr:HAMP domain-containing histidine kinase [Cyclobacteriaceae bacterium]
MKLQTKLIFILIGIFFTYSLLFSGFIYYSISNYAFTDFYKRLEIRAATTAKIQLEPHNEVSSVREIRQEYLEKLPNQREFVIKLNEEASESNIPKDVPMSFVSEIISNDAASYSNKNIYYSGIKYRNSSNEDYIVIISAENYFNTHHIAYLRNLLLTSLAFALLLIVMVSFIFSQTLVQPVNKIISAVQEISSQNLHLRLPIPQHEDSLGRLVTTFNDMLNRLETSFETQKNFISNASHELNTPLTSIIGEADLALSRDRKPEEYRESLNTMLKEAEKLDKKTKALLFLAETGFDGKSQKFNKIRVDQLVLDVTSTVEKINPKAKISIDFSLLPESPEMLKIKGNDQLLHLALSNVILNGCKYSDNNVVQVAVGASDKSVIVIIKDSGIGIPESDLAYIFDPYFRASNAKSFEGYGIGLPLARNIVKMHNGELIVASTLNEGTTVRINLPLGNYTL